MNKCILMGRLTRDPELFTGSTNVSKYSIAVDRKFKKEGEQSADFFSCVSFGKQSDFVQRYLKKGSKVVVAGRIENNTYTDKTGVKKTTTQIIVEEVEFAESKNESSEKKDDNSFLQVDDIVDLPFM